MRHRAFLCAILAGVSTQAFAQAGVQPESTPQTSAQDSAQEGATDPTITPAPGDEILVTAQRREQALQDVTASVVAIGADRLADAHINNLQDLQTVVPSVNFGSDFNQAKIFVRGVGANTSTTGNATGVALHVDGAVVARAEAQLTSLFDLERVEVLRGPQGTLYGRNATGGSINLITAKPTSDLSGYSRLTYGNYNALVAEGAVSGPITDNILYRFALKTERRDGFGENPVTGVDVDDLNRIMARAHLEFDFSDTTDLLLTGEYFKQDDHSGAIHYLRASFPGVARLAPLGVGGYATRPRDLASETTLGTETDTYSLTGTFRSELTDSLTLTDIANYRKFDSSLFQDLDLSSVIDSLQTNGQATTIQERRIDSTQWSNELQFNYSRQFVDLVVGAFYFHERQRPIDNVGLTNRNGMASNIPRLLAAGVDLNEAYALCGYGPPPPGSNNILAPKRVCIHSDLGTDAWAVFGQANIDLGLLSPSLEGFTIKLGGRFSHEKVTSANPAIIIAANGAGPVLRSTAAPSPIGVSTTAAPTGGAGTYVERTFEDFTPEVGLSWEPTRDLNIYYTYSEGFKAGSGENAAGSRVIVDPEKIQNHEVGIKATVLNGLSVNLAAYMYDLEGAQLNKTVSGGPAGFSTIFQNAASTTAKGVELDIFGRITPQFRISASASYTDAKFVDYVTLDPLDPRNVSTPGGAYNPVTNPSPTAFGAPCAGDLNPATPTCEIQLAGNRVRNTPEWAWNVHPEYDVPMNSGTLTLSADVSYKSRVYFSEYQREIESSAPYTMVDASATWHTMDDHLSFQVWGKNLFDIDRASSTFALATGRLIGVTYLPPRTFGVTLG
jgi:iron complex outermembrane receptor protein